MATVATPYGLQPVNLLGGRVFAGSTRKLPIASGYATNIFTGDPVLISGGNIQRDSGTTTATPIGVFLGASWMDPTFGFTFREYWPASTVPSANIGSAAPTASTQAFVLDDPYAIFKIQATGAVTASSLGKNAALSTATAGSTFTGVSGVALDQSSIATTSTLPLRIVDFVYGPTSTPGDAFTDVLVMWNFGTHEYLNATGRS